MNWWKSWRRRRRSQREDRKKILFLIDLENLLLNAGLFPPERFSLANELDRITKQITDEVGNITNTFVCSPPSQAYGEVCYEMRFFNIACAKVRNKEGREVDTVDQTLVEFGEQMILQIPNLTHLCLGSGDKDFSRFVRWAKLQGLKIIIVAGNLTSLSRELIELADVNPETGRKMIYLLSPTEE